MNVSLLITCLSDQFYPRVGRAVVAVLQHLGCAVDFPAAQTCCGQPMYNSGYADDAAALARHTIDVFEHSAHVVTPSGSCCAMVRRHYPALLADDPAYAPRARAMAEKTYEFVEYLTRVLDVDLRELGCRWDGRVTCHDACHLRELGAMGESDRLLAQVEGLEHVPLGKRDRCCGFGGTFAVKYPQISGAMAGDKAGCIAASEAPTVVCNDGGCAMHIAGACRRRGVSVELKHIAEVIAEGLGLMDAGSV